MSGIGIYAGTFDPVHQGHIAFALVAARVAKLERIVFILEPNPRIKKEVTTLTDRLEMLRLATKNHPMLDVAELSDQQFDVQTLTKLQKRFGQQLTLLFGSDVAKTMAAWPESEKLFARVELVIALRDGDTRADIEQALTGTNATFVCAPSPNDTVSSSKVRLGERFEDLNNNVAAYIASKQLYGLAPATN